MKTAWFAVSLLLAAAPVAAQGVRVVLNGMPTNLLVDWGGVAASPDATVGNAFVALMPLSAVSTWATFESGLAMDTTFGAGNWLRCTMTATDWAYLSADACAHLPGSNGGTPYTAPLSLLTTDFDFGPYAGATGTPQFPTPDTTLFPRTQASFVEGLGSTQLPQEHWQLRTRGFAGTNLWNACPGSTSVDPNFTGWLAARFAFSFF